MFYVILISVVMVALFLIFRDDTTNRIIRTSILLLGYIPRTQLDDYEDFNEDDVVCPFVGEIELDGWG